MDVTEPLAKLISSIVLNITQSFFDFFNIEALLNVIRNIGETLGVADLYIHGYRIPYLVFVLASFLFTLNLLYHVYLGMQGRMDWTRILIRMAFTALALSLFLTPGAPCKQGEAGFPCTPEGKVQSQVLPKETIKVEKGSGYEVTTENGKIFLVPKVDSSTTTLELPERRIFYFETDFPGGLGTKALLSLLDLTASTGQRLFYAEVYRYQEAIKSAREGLFNLTTLIFQTQMTASIIKQAVISGLMGVIPGGGLKKEAGKEAGNLLKGLFKGKKAPSFLQGALIAFGGTVDSARMAVARALFSFAEILAALPFALIAIFSLTFWSFVFAGKFAIYAFPLFVSIGPLFPKAVQAFAKRMIFLIVFPFLLGAVFAVSAKLLFVASLDKLLADLKETKTDIEKLELYKDSGIGIAAVVAMEVSRKQLLNTYGCLTKKIPSSVSCYGMDKLLDMDPTASPDDFAYQVAVAFSGGAEDPKGAWGWTRDTTKLKPVQGEDGKWYLLPEHLYIPVVLKADGEVSPLPLSTLVRGPNVAAPHSLEEFVNDKKAMDEDSVSVFGEPIMSSYFTRLASRILAEKDPSAKKALAETLKGELGAFAKDLGVKLNSLSVAPEKGDSLMDDARTIFGEGLRWEMGFPYTPEEVLKALEGVDGKSLFYLSEGAIKEGKPLLERVMSEVPDVARSIWGDPKKEERYSLFAPSKLKAFLQGGSFPLGSPFNLKVYGLDLPFAPKGKRLAAETDIQRYFLDFYLEMTKQDKLRKDQQAPVKAVTMLPGQPYDPEYRQKVGIPYHRGVDLWIVGPDGPDRAPVYWPFDVAKVEKVGYSNSYGNRIIARVLSKVPCNVILAHFNSINPNVREGTFLNAGDLIGWQGGTPWVDSSRTQYKFRPHLHVEPVCNPSNPDEPERTDPRAFYQLIVQWIPPDATRAKTQLNPDLYPVLIYPYKMDPSRMAPFVPYLYMDALYMMESVAVSNIDKVMQMASKKGALLFFFLIAAVLALTVSRATAQAIDGLVELVGSRAWAQLGEELAGRVVLVQAYLVPAQRLTQVKPLRTAGLPPIYAPSLTVPKVAPDFALERGGLEGLKEGVSEEDFLKTLFGEEAHYTERINAVTKALAEKEGLRNDWLTEWLYGKEPLPPGLEKEYLAWMEEMKEVVQKELRKGEEEGEKSDTEKASMEALKEIGPLVSKLLEKLTLTVRGAIHGVFSIGGGSSLVVASATEGSENLARGIEELYKTGPHAFLPGSWKRERIKAYQGGDALARLKEIKTSWEKVPPIVERLLELYEGKGGEVLQRPSSLTLVEARLPGVPPVYVLADDLEGFLKRNQSEGVRESLKEWLDKTEELRQVLEDFTRRPANNEDALHQKLLLALNLARYSEPDEFEAALRKHVRNGKQPIPKRIRKLFSEVARVSGSFTLKDALEKSLGPAGSQLVNALPMASALTMNPSELKNWLERRAKEQIKERLDGDPKKKKLGLRERLRKLAPISENEGRRVALEKEIKGLEEALKKGKGFYYHQGYLSALEEAIKDVEKFWEEYERLTPSQKEAFHNATAEALEDMLAKNVSLPASAKIDDSLIEAIRSGRAFEELGTRLKEVRKVYQEYKAAFEKVSKKFYLLRRTPLNVALPTFTEEGTEKDEEEKELG
jgi:murein DD-endopeptidase MepM/ murein hydrolase activator NlpD